MGSQSVDFPESRMERFNLEAITSVHCGEKETSASMQIKLYTEGGAQVTFVKNNSGGFIQTLYVWQWLVTCSNQGD